jgi:hypothetical protein
MIATQIWFDMVNIKKVYLEFKVATMDSRVSSSEASMIERGMNGQRLPIRVGAVSGLVGATGIIAIVTVILLVNGVELFAAPRLIASVMYGADTTGVMPVIVGTLIHLVTGTALGAVFALLMPAIHRIFWMVGGMIYGIGAFMVSALVILPLFTPDSLAAQTSVGILLIAHVIYGFILGVLGGTYGWFWGPRIPAA